jgi:hypothetical protein
MLRLEALTAFLVWAVFVWSTADAMVSAPNVAPMLNDIAAAPSKLESQMKLHERDDPAQPLQVQIHRLLRTILSSAAASSASFKKGGTQAAGSATNTTNDAADGNKNNAGNNYAPIFGGDAIRADVASRVRSARQDNDNDNNNNNNNDNNNDSPNTMQTGPWSSLSEGGAIVMLTDGRASGLEKQDIETSNRLVLTDSRTTHRDNWQVVVNVNLNLNANLNDNINRLQEQAGAAKA